MVTKFFKEFSGDKTAFKNGGYETTLANNIVFITDEANNGAGACIFTRGMYFADFKSLIEALAFVKGINVGGTNYNAANGGGYVKFEAADPATVVYVENNGIKIGLSAAFVEAHDAVIADVAAIKADYLKGADKEALQKSINDKDAAMKQYVDAEIAKVATSEAFNALTGRVSTLEGEIVTERGRIDGIINTTIPALEQSIATEKGRIDVIAPKVETLIGSDANMSARAIVQDEVAKQLQSENITESFDTLKEMAEYLSSHPEDVTKMTADIKQNADDIDAIEKELENLATSESLGALEVRVKANEDAVATVDTRISTAVSAAEGRVDTKLADYAKTADVNEELGKKADQSAMETALGNKADKSELSNYQTVAGMPTVLAPYAKTEDVNASLAGKANVGDSYLKSEMDTKLSGKADKTSVYTKNEADSKIATELEPYAKTAAVEGLVAPKADKTYVDEELAKKAGAGDSYLKSETYTKEEVNGLVSPKADKSYVDTELGKKADASTTYSKTEVDGLVAPKANAADVYTKTEVDNMFAWERIEA